MTAAPSVESLESFSGAEAYDSAREVADALRAFQDAGAAAGDIGFWRKRVSHFQSPKAYALVVDALLEKPDRVAAMALLLQWLSQADTIPLKQAEYSFHNLADRWLSDTCRSVTGLADSQSPIDPQARAATVRKFFELLEANAEDYWQVPTLDLLATPVEESTNPVSSDEDHADPDDEDPELFRAAYDDVVYIDSTGDGVESDMLESGPAPATDFELEQEARRAGDRLTFLRTIATLWKKAVLECGPPPSSSLGDETLQRWLEQAVDNERQLLVLLKAVSERKIPAPSASRDSLMEFDRRRGVKEVLIEKIIATTIETSDAARAMRAALPAPRESKGEPMEAVLRAAMRGDRTEVEQRWPSFLESLRTQPLLYVPLAKGGDPARLAQTRTLQQALRDLLEWLPRLGLFGQTCQLIEMARLMESANPVGPGAISEFDRLFAAGYEAIVDSLLTVSATWAETGAEQADSDLIECLEQVTESLLKQWLAHSRTLRLSAVEKITDEKHWQAIVDFTQRYGSDLFTQRFLNLGNLRAILHRGVDVWLAELEGGPEGEVRPILLNELGGKISREEAVKLLTIVIESIVENYAEYRDYNSTTTQSDRGDQLFTLLDFLRLRVHYDRVAWHLKPVMAAHAILVRRGRTAAAESWRRALAERTGELADSLQSRCADLRKKYAMRLPTVSDRIGERFVRPLTVDRVQALVKPAMDEVRMHGSAGESQCEGEAFHLLEQEIEELTQEPTGIGIDAPAWLVALEQEVETQRRINRATQTIQETRTPIAQVNLSVEEVQNQLSSWESKQR